MRIATKVLKLFASLVMVLVGVVACQDYRNGRGPDLQPPSEDVLRIATYNVHYIVDLGGDGRWDVPGWEKRKAPLAKTVGALGADVIAFQEMETFRRSNEDSNNLARTFLLGQHPEYAAAAIGDWREFPSTQPIFFRRDRMELLEQGWFFFSDTPDQIYSRTFNGSYPAFASWAELRDLRTGASLRVVNVHTDFSSRENRVRSIDLVAERIEPWIAAGERVFVVGDLNARLGSSLHKTLEDVGLEFVSIEGATFHLDIGLNLFGAIDHIGFTGVEAVGDGMVFRSRLGDVWPTDHYPLVADFRLTR